MYIDQKYNTKGEKNNKEIFTVQKVGKALWADQMEKKLKLV